MTANAHSATRAPLALPCETLRATGSDIDDADGDHSVTGADSTLQDKGGSGGSKVVVRIPDPEQVPTMPLWPDVGQVLGLGRSATYEAAGRGEIPVLHFGRRCVVPTAALRRMLAMDDRPADG